MSETRKIHIQSKKKSAILNLVIGTFGKILTIATTIIISGLIINDKGSDLNGINSIINQIISFVVYLEVAIVASSTVALFAPLASGDQSKIASIIKTISIYFNKIALILIIPFLLLIFVFPFFIKTEIEYWYIVTIFSLSVVPSYVSIFLNTKYSAIFQASQRLYILTAISVATSLFTFIPSYLLLVNGYDYLYVRLVYAICTILGSTMIYIIYRIIFKISTEDALYDKTVVSDFLDVLIQQFVVGIVTVAPMILISTIFPDGSLEASVFSVYLLIHTSVLSFIYIFSNSIKYGFGALLKSSDLDAALRVFKKYILVSISVGLIFSVITFFCLSPFLSVYIKQNDIQYHVESFLYMFPLGILIESIRIPISATLNMAGEFKAIRKSCLFSLFIFVGVLCLLFFERNVLYIKLALITTSFCRLVVEYVLIQKKIFHVGCHFTVRVVSFVLTSTLAFVLIHIFCNFGVEWIYGEWGKLLLYGLIISLLVFVIVFIFLITFFPKTLKKVVSIAKRVFVR